MQNVLRADWKIPLAQLALSATPCATGFVRLIGLVGIVTGNSERFLASPLITWLHIVTASLFCLLGAFQFSAGLRRHFPRWH